MKITYEVARLCNTLRFDQLTDQTIDRTKYLLLDYSGVALRGSQSLSTQPIYRFLLDRCGTHTAVPVPATTLRVDTPYAALAMGAAAHSLELDDVVNEASLHPAVSVISTALGVGYQCKSTGKELLTAIVAGYETMVKLGIALDPAAHYQRGFHPTATCGTFGAAVAASKLLGLDTDQTVNALGIAGSQAAGSMEFLADGAYTKRFHGGWSAHSGVIAALLAREGFTGPASIIEGTFGFLHAYSLSSSPEKVLGRWGKPYEVMKTSIKPHACCRYKQGAIDCILQLRKDHTLTVRDIKEVNISILKAGFALVADPIATKRNPLSIVDAQFSMPFGAAVAILQGNAFLDQYSLENINAEETRDLMKKVHCLDNEAIEKDFPRKWPAHVEIVTNDGRTLTAQLDHPKGDPENPLSWDEIITKFTRLVQPVLPSAAMDTIIEKVRDIDASDNIRDLLDNMVKEGWSLS